MNHPGPVEQLMVAKAPLTIFFAEVLQPQHLPARIAEYRHGQINVAIAVQIPRFHIGHAPHVIKQDVLREMVPFVFQQHNSTDEFVPGKDAAQDGDDHIEIAIFVQVHHRCVSRTLQIVGQNPLRELTA